MRKLYNFDELPNKAQKNAAGSVYDEEIKDSRDFDIDMDYDLITQDIEEELKEYGMTCAKVVWAARPYVDLKLEGVKRTPAMLGMVLSEDEIKLYQDLYYLSDTFLTEKFFDVDYNSDGYKLEYNYPAAGHNKDKALEFMKHYSKDDIRKYRLPALVGKYDELDKDIANLAERLTATLDKKISDYIDGIVKKLKMYIRNQYDYIGSEDYYHDKLSDGEITNYMFNYQGKTILKNHEFINYENEELYAV